MKVSNRSEYGCKKLVLLLVFLFSIIVNSQAQPLLGQEVDAPKRETRAVWVTTLNGLDWPKSSAFTAAGRERQKQELCDILDKLKAININTVLLQTRVRASVIYPSKIEPWDVALTSHYNTAPGYDPLKFAIDECHKRGMELHAWVVTIPAYKLAVAKSMGKDGLHVKKAQLVKKHNDQYYLDPGLPETGDYLTSICEEIVRNYDVDGLHFDYIRYPEGASSFADEQTYRKYGNGKSKSQWRRDNLTRIVRQIYTTVKAIKPWVKITSSPVGKSHDLSRYSSKGWNCYETVHQDAQGWLKQGIHDGLFPMMYFKGDHFFPFAADWREQDNGRPVTPGLGIYFMHPSEKNWPLSDITNQLHYTRQQQLGGQAYFRSRFLTDNVKGLYDYLNNTFYAYPSLPQAATWLDSIAPSMPTDFKEEQLENGMTRLTWKACTDNVAEGGVFYNVYASTTWPVDVENAENILATRLTEPTFTYNTYWAQLQGLYVVVAAMDRFGNEGQSAGVNGVNTLPKFPWENSCVRVVMSDSNGCLTLPERSVPYYVITDVYGRIVQTGKYNTSIRVNQLPTGWYTVRTLQKKGVSRMLFEFWKPM